MTRRFCILLHDHPFWHWDFLLENSDHAICWRLLRQPCLNEPIAAEQLPPHRLLYLDYEGPVSHDRGVVQRMASGTYDVISNDPGKVLHLTGLDWARYAILDASNDNRAFWWFRSELE